MKRKTLIRDALFALAVVAWFGWVIAVNTFLHRRSPLAEVWMFVNLALVLVASGYVCYTERKRVWDYWIRGERL